MRPVLEAGDRLVVAGWCRVRPGDLAAVRDPRSPSRTMVKRVVARRFGGVEVAGDNTAASTDSRDFGPVPMRLVRGRVVWRYLPVSRQGKPGRPTIG